MKIEKYAWKINADSELRESLSAAEQEYAAKYSDIASRHFSDSVLKNLPTDFQQFPDSART